MFRDYIIDIKVNLIYLWREHKGKISDALIVLSFPIWGLFALPILFIDDCIKDCDEMWCECHGYDYDGCVTKHGDVRGYKKIERKRKKDDVEFKKNIIRIEIKNRYEKI